MNLDKEKRHYFTITDNLGKIQEYEILFTFDREDEKKSYVVFTDNLKDEAGSINAYAATYTKEGECLNLGNIETEYEWSLVESLMAQIEDKVNEE